MRNCYNIKCKHFTFTAPPLCLQCINTFEVTEVTYGQPQQLGCEDNEDLEEKNDLLK